MTAIDRESVTLATMADDLRKRANAANGYHAQQYGGTYGPADSAVKIALACGLTSVNRIHFDVARDIANDIDFSVMNNGESVEYNLGVHGIEIIEPDVDDAIAELRRKLSV